MGNTAWKNFNGGKWQTEINVADFINANFTSYHGNSDFLQGATKRTNAVMEKVNALLKAEREKGGVFSTLT